MNDFTLTLRDALLSIDPGEIASLAKRNLIIDFAGKKLKPGRYARSKVYAKAFLIVSEDGKVYYQNKQGRLSKRLTEQAFLTHWNSGMSTFIG